MKPDILEDLNVEESGLQDGSGGDSAGSSIASVSQHSNDLDINVLNSRDGSISVTQDALSVVSDTTENGNSTLISENNDSQTQNGLHVVWGIKDEFLRGNGNEIDLQADAGECAMRILFKDFMFIVTKKMEEVMADPDRPLSKILTRGEDAQFDQILMAFGSVSEYCLPSLLRALFAWYDLQLNSDDSNNGTAEPKKTDLKGKSSEASDSKDTDWLQERRDLAVEFIFCLVLTEVLLSLEFHPGHDKLITHLEDIAFKHFKYREGTQSGPNACNIHALADLYAEVVGLIAQWRFPNIRNRFSSELKELRSKELNPYTTQSIISLLMGMKFLRVKMVPINLLEMSFAFLQECAQYFLEVKDKDIKHALAGLFVEILIPVAASVKNEVNVPCLKNFVDSLYTQTMDMCAKSKHRLAIFPLVTCLLCVSQKSFFLQNWHYFLAMCLSNLKNRDPKMSRVALESLYRLIWVYMIRIKCESNSATSSRLQSIVNSLFPKGSKAVVPRDTPLNIFVKIIQFIAQERLDFAMREIVFDLLSVGRPIKVILTPERMNIGLRAFLVVSDSLQQKEGDPPMPRTSGVLPSGNTLRVKKTFLNKLLTEDAAKGIGMSAYFSHVKRVFVDILRGLDIHYGRPLMMTSTQNVNKEPDEMLTGERKPRIDLFRTCVAAIPRLIPENMTRTELVDLLSRLTMHMDEELRGLSFQSLQTLMIDFPDWRHDVIHGFVQFLSRDLHDTFPNLFDNGLRMGLQLLTTWKNAVSPSLTSKSSTRKIDKIQQNSTEVDIITNVLHYVESFCLVILCSSRVCPRRLAIHILREVKFLLKSIGKQEDDKPLIDVLDKNSFRVLEQSLSVLPTNDKGALLISSNIDLQWIADRAFTWTPSVLEEGNPKTSLLNLRSCSSTLDIWTLCMFGFLQKDILFSQCPSAISQTWPIVYNRLHTLFSVIDPTPVSDNRASLLRSSAPPRKPTSERDQYMVLWRCYVIFATRVVPTVPNPVIRCASPDLSLSLQGTLNLHNFLKHAWEEFENESHSLNCMSVSEPKTWRFRASSSPDNMQIAERSSDSKSVNVSPSGLYKLLVPLLRCEVADVKDAAVFALSSINADALKDLMEELAPYIREAIDRKQENMRRRRRRDTLRLNLVKTFEFIAEHGTFGTSPCVLDRDTHTLNPTIVEYIDGARLCLETEADKDSIPDIKLHFCNFIRNVIRSFPIDVYPTLLTRDLRSKLFTLFANWSGPFCSSLNTVSPAVTTTAVSNTSECLNLNEEELQFAALQALSAVLCCGPCFDASILAEEGPLYSWLDALLASKVEKVYHLAYTTVILLLECNTDVGALLDWVVDRCYTAKPQIADGCFLALAAIFSAREYPCDHYTAIINVTLMNTGCPRINVRESALQLLQILDKRFFGSVSLLPPECESTGGAAEDTGRTTDTIDLLMSTTYCCSQIQLSHQLAQLHPELTMPMFSEITYRFQTARPEVRQLLLQYLLPWLHNMELVDPNIAAICCLPNDQFPSTNDLRRSDSRREGWGSAEATEMVLNNLFYVTVKFSDEHTKEIEEVWATLCTCWPNNLKIIIRYLVIISGMAPNELLTYTKRVTVYLARASADKLLDEMLVELQTVETLNCLIERTETPPFYRLTSIRKVSNYSDPDPHADQDGSGSEVSVEKGTIHTKRHSGEESSANTGGTKPDSTPRTVAGSRYTTPKNSKLISHVLEENITLQIENEMPSIIMTVNEEDCSPTRLRGDNFDITQPHPLPMPEYGGYFAPLRDYLPETVQPSSGFHRCNVAVMLLTDVVTDTSEVDWSAHLPLILHMLFLGLDQGRNLIYQHCKQLLLNLLVVVADHSDHLSVAQTLLNRKTAQLEIGLPPVQPVPHNFTEPDSAFDNYLRIPISSVSQSTSMIMLPSPTETIVSPTSPNVNDFSAGFTDEEPPFSPVTRNTSIQNVIKSLVDFIASRKDQVLWNYEDITAKVWSVKSAEQLDIFLQHVLRIFQESMPDVLISERWAQIALQLGLSCSSRHIAGRSLQVFRFLRVPVNSRMLSDILSRLVETIAEQGEDMQGYVTELLLTLESAVDSLDSDFRSLDYMKEIFKSTPNLNKDLNVTAVKRSVGGVCLHATGHHANATAHTRSTSYSASYHNCVTKTAGSPPNLHLVKDTRKESDVEVKHGSSNLNKSRSVQSLKLLSDTASQDDKMTILAQLFWLGVSLLESDYEHEYLLALRVLSRVIRRMPLDRPDTSDKVEKIFNQLKWTSFQGLHSLLLKGCTNPSIYESVVPVLSEFILYLDVPVIDPTQGLAFPLTVAAVLPYLILYYEDANEHCISSAEYIAQASSGKISKLDNLATIMTLYSRRTFNKESLQWTKCVMKYLHESFPKYTSNMLSLLVEILEKGPNSIQLPVLSVIYCLFHYLDLSPTTSHSFSIEMLIPILKHVEGPHYKECIKILNIIVTRSAILLKNPSFYQYPFLESHMGSALNPKLTGIEVKIKKELPGRTMDFSFDSSHMLIIPKYKSSTKADIDKSDDTKTTNDQSTQSAANGVSTLQSNTEHPVCSPRRSSSLSPADNAAVGWKRPWLCQSRVRECLVSLLTTCGQRVGLPKSPSVIFSQSSDLLEKQSSMASSTEEVSGPDLSDSRRDNNDHFGVFKDFDFLEYESESVEGESTDNFNWGVRRRLLSAGDGEGEGDVAITSQAQDSISEKSPLLTIKKLDNENEPNNSALIDDSSDEELGSESPLDEIIPNNMTGSRSSSSLRLLNNEDGRDTPTHSDISDSSVADIGDLTPCNTSPLLPVLHSFRPIHRDNNEEIWRVQICSLMDQVPLSSLHLYHIVYRLIKDVVHKAISLTQIANSLFTQYESGSETLQNHLSTISNILTDCCTQPPFVWFNASYVPLTEFLHFDALQLREHLDTLLDRKEHVNECIETLRAILKLQQLSDEQPNNDNINAEEAICDLGRGLYKFHFQLLLLLDSAEKMYRTLKYNAKRAKLQDVSDEVTLLKKTLIRIRRECSDYGESDSQELHHESISLPCHSNNPVLQYLHDGKYFDALRYIKKTRVMWPNDLICSPSDENEVINAVSIYCSNLLETRPESFVIINEEELTDVHNKLMDELLQILNTVNELELHVKEKRKHYRDH